MSTSSSRPDAVAGSAGETLGMPATLDVSVVVPYYNPGERLRTTVERTADVLRSAGVTFEIITVSDGSTDGSEATLAGLPEELVRRVELEHNEGKGQALQVGLSMGRGRYLGFLDADGDLSPELLAPFVSLMRIYEPDIILGSKRHPMSSVHYPPLRRLYSMGYQALIRVLFHLDVKDTQVGIKLVKREVIASVLPLLVERRFAFDLELIVVARHLGFDRLFEAPVRIEERFRSTISARAVRGMLVDTLAIFTRLRVLHRYGRARAAVGSREPDGS
jgi:glycosyltransferase involved in cell wall biosynthesis